MSMKRFICLFGILFVCVCCAAAFASEADMQYRVALSLTLDARALAAEPFDRWLSELAQMIQPVVEYASWPEGEALSVEVQANGQAAFSVTLYDVQGRLLLSSSLMGEGAVRLTGRDELEARALMEYIAVRLAPDTDWPLADLTLSMNAGRCAAWFERAGDTLNRLSQRAVGESAEITAAMGYVAGFFAEQAAAADENAPMLSVYAAYQPPVFDISAISAATLDYALSPDELPAVLLSEMPRSVIRAICAGLEQPGRP